MSNTASSSPIDTLATVIEKVEPKTYTVNKGDTFSKIANDRGMTRDELQAMNPDIKNINIINIGQVLNVSSNPDTATAVAGNTTQKIANAPVSQPSIATKPRVAVASKPANGRAQKPAAPENVAKSPQQELDDARLQLATATGVLLSSPNTNKVFYEDMKKQAEADITRLTTAINKQEAIAKYNNLSPNGKMHADYSTRFQELTAASIRP
jgi:LysM repeat protein